MITLTCLVPAYNEAPRIAGVLACVLGHSGVTRTIVIDDGSTDDTAAVARASGATVLATPGNLGKTAALALGLAQVRTSHVLLLDADLTGLTDAALTALIAPVSDGQAAAAISLRGNAPRTWRLLGVDYISGERVIAMDLLSTQIDRLPQLPRFGFEVFLNRLLIVRNSPVAIVPWPDVASPSKVSKRGLWGGLWADVLMIRDILRTVSAPEVIRQIIALRRLNKLAVSGAIGLLPPGAPVARGQDYPA